MMEGTGHRRHGNKKASVGTLLLLTCMFIPTFPLLQELEAPTCPDGDYLSEKGICCNKCSPGFKLVEECHGEKQRSNCTPCADGQYTDQMNFITSCRRCRRCKSSNHEIQESPCEKHKNTICRCKDGFYKVKIDSEASECLQCSSCRHDETPIQMCTQNKNTVCGCKPNYYRVNNRCELCKNCTAECNHHCSRLAVNTEAPGSKHQLLVNVIAGAAVVVFVLLVLVALLTYVATKRFTKKKLLNPSSKPSDGSLDCEKVLIFREEASENNNLKAIAQSPVSEMELSNLPDCVPLEIKIPDLIYMVLDHVPVQQVKQLVRSLGVKDTEIEQAEMDHRSCREAHYQMLRVWAERGSRAGGGAQGEMLHWPPLQELLDRLRKMHLGRAAEELETKYGIQ